MLLSEMGLALNTILGRDATFVFFQLVLLESRGSALKREKYGSVSRHEEIRALPFFPVELLFSWSVSHYRVR
jgi:hypothetical protein